MKKSLKYIAVPLVCIFVVVATFYIISKVENKVEEQNYGTDNIAINSNNSNTVNFVSNSSINEENNVINDTDNFESNIVSNTTVNTNTDTNITSNNNDIQNNNENNTVQNNLVTNENVDNNVTNEKEDNYSNTKQESAIDLVKKYWGEDNTVYFTNENITSDGEYIVAVRQKSSTTVKEYFKVNITTKKVELYF